MGFVAVLVAAVAGFGVGAVWYSMVSKPWIADSGVPVDTQGNPMGRPVAVAYGGGFLGILVVAGMMRHMLATAGIAAPAPGAVAGLGVGLFLIMPWLMMNVLYANRPLRLAAIDGVYAAAGCGITGLVLGLML